MKLNSDNILSALQRWLKRFIYFTLSVWLISIAIFKYLPVPYSAVIFERQLTAWATGNNHYQTEKIWANQENISPNIYLAVIAGEDQKFQTHWGLDFDAIKHAMLHNENQASSIHGASTISQQMVKNLFLWDGHSWIRKALEAALTLTVELCWNKERILTVYLNIVEFGDGIFGVEAAAHKFFNKPAKKLTLQEATLLASVLPNPHIFKVNHPSDYVKYRQKWILKQTQQLGGLNYIKDLHLRSLTIATKK